jgi:ABC-type nitrate/sulfonate/bicarbonate transport system substrate-binding protein
MTKFILGLLVSGGLLQMAVSNVDAQTKPVRPFRVNVFRVDAAMAVAKARGLFAAEGLGVTTTGTSNSTDQMRGLSKGNYELLSTAFDNVLAWSGREGAEIIAVAQPTDKAMLPLYVRPEIREWKDLRGKKLAADAVDTAYALVLRRILLAHGLDLERGDYELIAVGATPLRLESMKRGETFASILNPPVDAEGEAAGFKRMADQRDVLPDYAATVLAVNRAWAQNNRADVIGFLRAWTAAVGWVNDSTNAEEAHKIVQAELKLNPKVAAERIAELTKTGELNMRGLESPLNLRTQFGFKLPMGAAVERYYDRSYYDAAVRK